MSGDSHDLRNRATSLRKRHRGVLPESVDRIAVNADSSNCLRTIAAKLAALYGAPLACENEFTLARQRGQCRPQPFVTWYRDRFTSLLLHHFDCVAVELTPPHLHHVRSALPGVQQEHHTYSQVAGCGSIEGGQHAIGPRLVFLFGLVQARHADGRICA